MTLYVVKKNFSVRQCVIGFAVICLAVIGFFATTASAMERVIYVAPNGSDSFSGTCATVNAEKTDGPLATPAEAIQRVAKIRQSRIRLVGPVVVELADGIYELAETLRLDPSINGTEESPTIFRAAKNARPVISGGQTLSGWTVGSDGRWRMILDDVKNGDWYFQQLFVDNQRRFRPRMPKNADYTITERVESPSATNPRGGDTQFRFSGDEILSEWKNLTDVEVLAYHNWTLSRQKIAAVADAEKIVTVQGASPSNSYWGVYTAGHRYFVENVFESLSEPGEFYLDRASGELTYIPREGERPDHSVVVAPRQEYLLTIAGTTEQYVQNLRFEGLTFAFSNWTTPAQGNSSAQAEVEVDATVVLVGGRHVTFTECGFRNLGQYGVSFGTACKDCAMVGCAMKDLGGGGIRIGGDLYQSGGWPYESPLNKTLYDLPRDEQIVERISLSDSKLEFLGRLHPAAIGVWIGHAANNTVSQCEIFDLYYSAVSVGWVWGYSESVANHNIVEKNHLHKIGQKLLSDMGAVYTLGISPGTKVTHNLIHDVDSFDYGGWGLYTDEGSTGIEMSHNIVYNTKTGSFHQHYGQDNRIEYNILVNSREHQLQRTRMEPHNSFFFEHNIVYWENDSPLLASSWTDENFTMDYNLYWNPTKKEAITFGGMSFDAWKETKLKDKHSILADPLFEDVAAHDFRLKAGSPAEKLRITIPDHFGPKSAPTLLDDIPSPASGFVLPR